MAELGAVAEDVRKASQVAELDLLRTITAAIATFGAKVRDSALSDEQKSKVLANLAEASGSMMSATNAYLFAFRPMKPAPERDNAPVAAAEKAG